MNQPLKIAILGLGRQGRQLLRVLKPRCLVVSYPFAIGSDHRKNEALSDPSINAVVIATPIETHAAYAEAALRAGKHVFVEKPMTTDVESAKRLVSLAEASGLTLFVGHVFLHNPAFARLQEIIGDNKVTYLQCVWRKFGTFESDLILNLASHEVSLALALFGSLPEKSEVIHSRGLVTKTDVFIAKMSFNGVPCLINIDRCSRETQKMVTVAIEDRVMIWDGPYLFSLKPGGETQLLFETHAEPLACEMNMFLDACSSGGSTITDGRHGLAVVQTLSQIIESQK